MAKLIAACGLDCAQCDGYIATQANDSVAIAALVEKVARDFGMEVKPEQIMCDGCLAESERKCSYCKECGIRACVVTNKLANCAECGVYACKLLEDFFVHSPKAKENLEEIRKE